MRALIGAIWLIGGGIWFCVAVVQGRDFIDPHVLSFVCAAVMMLTGVILAMPNHEGKK